MVKKTILTPKLKKEVSLYATQLRQNNINYQQLIVFGSHAKGKQHLGSDIDLCIVDRSFGKNRFEERVLLSKLKNQHTLNIEPHPYHPKDLANKWDTLANEINQYGLIFNP
ncbi:MAG: nucleotidyltransferase domain-containing protein [Candidatus Beckwithbacteria bacterium]|nr:nucleotidyltransferase domain-containing protein [Patescibacteria group bacterium]